jgi:glycosyltransferase involved in cell wall biosynthesis
MTATPPTAHVVVPYPVSNASVRARAVHWHDRLVAGGRVDEGRVAFHGPGFATDAVVPGTPLLLLRNARKLSRGRREAQLLATASLGVYDLDDGLPWDDGSLPGLGRWWKRPFPRSLLAQRAAGAADRVIAGNELLADWASDHCDDVRVVPTCVEPAEYDRRTDWTIEGRRPVIGWIGSPATEHYLVDIAPALQRVHAATGAELVVVSGRSKPAVELGPFTRRVQWDGASVRRIATWDIGIMPLRDGPYERAKCGYKLLQYAASGVPAVASPVGVNGPILEAMSGLPATTIEQWADAMITLIDEPATVRQARAERGFALADRYSYATWESRWLQAVGW